MSSNESSTTSNLSSAFKKIGYEFYNYEPFAHQYETIMFFLRFKKGYCFNDLGSGKTASSIWAFDILRFTGKVKRMMIICPLSIMETVWVKELRNITPHLNYAIMHGPRPKRLEALNSKADVIITNHDCVRTYRDEIIKANIDIIVIDELTAYKHHGSARSKAMQKIAARAKSVWGMTGTPITTGAMDAYGLAKVVNPKNLPTPYMTKFRNMVMYQIDMYNYEHKPEWERVVFNTLQPAIRFKTDECIDLPPITFETRRVKMHKDTDKVYKDMVNQQLHELKEGTITAVNAGVKFSKLLQIASGTVIDEEGVVHELNVQPKLDEMEVTLLESGKKLIVFTQFVATIHMIEKHFRGKYRVGTVSGQVPVKMRSRIFDEFQDGDLQILIAQVSTASHGLTLTASSHILFWTPIMGVEKFLQSIARIRRAGQTKHQHIVKLESCRVETELFKKLEGGKLTNDDILELYKNL